MNARAYGGQIGPDRPTLDAFVDALFRHADPGTVISLRAFNDDRRDQRPIFINKVKVGDALLGDFVFNLAGVAARHDLRANFCPPVCTFLGEDKADEASIANGVALTVECDANPQMSRHQLAALLGEPTVTSASGGMWVDPLTGEVHPKLHLHWRLTEPTRDQTSHATLKEARRLACFFAGADATAVPINHPLRWPGSVHRKGEPRLARIVKQTENELELTVAIEKLRAACPDALQRDAPRRAYAGFGFSPDLEGDGLDIAAALAVIPNADLSWSEWNRIAMATWKASSGRAFAAFDAWSQRSTKYDAQITAERWGHIGRHPPSDIGAGTLYFEAQQAAPGWRKPSSWAKETTRQKSARGASGGEPEGSQAKAKAGRSTKAPGREKDDTRPIIRLRAGVLAETVSAAEQALIQSDCGFYQRNNMVVSAGTAPMLTACSHTVVTPQIFEVGEHRILEEMMRAAVFEHWDARARAYVPANAPMTLPKTLKERKGKLRLPILSGLTNAPTLRGDGSLIDVPGYDAMSGLLFDPAGTRFPAVPHRPSRRDAEDAIGTIEALIEGFPFIGEAERSVALAAFLTAVVRKSLRTAPAFAFTAPVAGSGKSKLVDIMSVIATGREAGVIALGCNPEESEKRIASLLLVGCAVSIDNVEGSISGDLLCQVLTQTTTRMRVLGRSEVPELLTNVMVTMTGNNLSVEGDMTRRTLLCRLDPKVERPELREFSFDPVERAKAERGGLLVAALTVLRAYHVAGRPPQASPLGSFEEWSSLVRSALLWLGRADPVQTMEKSRAHDPKLERLRAVMAQWRKVIGSEALSAGEATQKASEKNANAFEPGKTAFVHPELREAFLAVAGTSGFVEPGRLGNWLSRNKGRVVEGMRFELAGIKHGFNQWQLVEDQPQSSDYAKRREMEDVAYAL